MLARGQAFIAFVTLGVGTILGTKMSDLVYNSYTVDTVSNWQMIWFILAAMALVTALAFDLLFRSKAEDVK
jgi:ABC-type transport system involved in cytochrome c biogenesis permease subunit